DTVGEDRLLLTAARQLLAATQQQVLAQLDVARDLGERRRTHQAGTALRELTLVDIRVLEVEHDRDGLAQDRVPEELEPLVVSDSAVLVRVRAVCERKGEQLGINLELQHRVQLGEIDLAGRRGGNTGRQRLRRRRPYGPCTRGTGACRRSPPRPSRGAGGCTRPCRSRSE